uniref:Peptidyl-prolyl cis-trans isomerase n=1 Tax=Candidatus Methanophaga sp. ANME-1 ERB7 TaxID=2759913 RepID=A0A7G9Z8P2_9EURY|nr:trigger factor [Methanosarcinales archaeon ANME-1 ERB7]QNO56591.1 trigger factor [Methanosarcinales archaeon ANME-1 ERB7]QNO56626.1 trigger factor [Methanosarcinales archaeon ANME-1 ERB7]
MMTEKKMRSRSTKLIGILAILIILLLASGCVEDGNLQPESKSVALEEHHEELVEDQNETAQAKVGDTIRVHYTGTLDNGTVFDSSVGREPLQFTIGLGQMIPGFDKGVVGLNLNESKTITIPADQAYGQYRADLVQVAARDQFPPDSELEVGQVLQVSQPNGQIILVTITNVTDTNVTLDANRPLAGKNLTFEIQLVEIVSSA